MIETILPAVKGGTDVISQGLFKPIITVHRRTVKHTKKRDITTEHTVNINGMDIAVCGAVLTVAMMMGVVGWKKHPYSTTKMVATGDAFRPYKYVTTTDYVALPCAGKTGTFGGWNGSLGGGDVAQIGAAASGGIIGMLIYALGIGK